jgi:Sigma-70, region 4
VIVRRAGLQGLKGGTRAAVAQRLGVSRARVAQLERRALRILRKRARAGSCTNKDPKGADQAAHEPASTSSAEGDPPVVNQVGAATKSAGSYADDHPLVFVLAILVALVCALLILRQLRRALQTTPRGEPRSQ